MPVDECKKNKLIATARCHPKDKADNRGVGEDGYFNGTTGLPVGIHLYMVSAVGQTGNILHLSVISIILF